MQCLTLNILEASNDVILVDVASLSHTQWPTGGHFDEGNWSYPHQNGRRQLSTKKLCNQFMIWKRYFWNVILGVREDKVVYNRYLYLGLCNNVSFSQNLRFCGRVMMRVTRFGSEGNSIWFLFSDEGNWTFLSDEGNFNFPFARLFLIIRFFFLQSIWP